MRDVQADLPEFRPVVRQPSTTPGGEVMLLGKRTRVCGGSRDPGSSFSERVVEVVLHVHPVCCCYCHPYSAYPPQFARRHYAKEQRPAARGGVLRFFLLSVSQDFPQLIHSTLLCSGSAGMDSRISETFVCHSGSSLGRPGLLSRTERAMLSVLHRISIPSLHTVMLHMMCMLGQAIAAC